VSLLLGLRPGDAAGLTWDHIHLDTQPPVLRVEHSLRRTNHGMVLTEPKTSSSRRTLVLPHPCVTALRGQQVRQESDRATAGQAWRNEHGLVFTTETGRPLDPSNVRRSLTAIATRAGLGHLHPHLLRHATASLLSAAGVPLEQNADVLGHRSPTITADIYRHPLTPVRDHHVPVMSDLAAFAEGHRRSTLP
jgi:integrase